MLTINDHYFQANLPNIAAARHLVGDRLRHSNWDYLRTDIIIAIGEVLQNIIRYGFGMAPGPNACFWISVSGTLHHLQITIEDNAPPSDPKSWRRHHRCAHEGGHGINLISGVVERAIFTPLADGNRVQLWFKRQ